MLNGSFAWYCQDFSWNILMNKLVSFQAITPSHSVPANVQNVLSMMKTHNPKLCGGSLSKSIGSHAKSPRSGYTSSGYFRYISNNMVC